ncbi:DUF4870 domain-containing protein [Massilia sp. Dwa41.01b]|uniref:DUF4870 domain-containing protein n=1 Tax=unclassified Massilia TaxID=2609279 RepID=UPI00185FE5FD|nr:MULTISPECIES: DUF4870 domain-containing protein [unclassified Massilia]QNA89463.1 DUF4870 domain-containing protein [Massilia sp. Dwa41.01b]QNB00368.1 DUF4870 domain-containing protein [Massilia sp. Se16.2.3]
MENATTPAVQSGDKTLAILVHLGGLFFSWLAPLIVYLVKKDEKDQFTTDNAREALNFQLTVLIAYFACFILTFVLIGILLFWVVMMANLVLTIVAAVKTSNGETYRYPVSIRMVK